MASMSLISAARVPLAQPAAVRPRRHSLLVAAGQGFGAAPQKAAGSVGSKKKQPKLARYLGEAPANTAVTADGSPGDGWVEMPGIDADTTFLSKPIKALILATGRAVCLYKVRHRSVHRCLARAHAGRRAAGWAQTVTCVGEQALAAPFTPRRPPCECLPQVNDRIYASDANSTAYKYPLADANILSVKGKPAGAAQQRLPAPSSGRSRICPAEAGKTCCWPS
jgi:hypothetical protein